jgi:hypothetical protein
VYDHYKHQSIMRRKIDLVKIGNCVTRLTRSWIFLFKSFITNRGFPRTTISSHSRFGRGITRYPARNQKTAHFYPLPDEGDLATTVKSLHTPDCILDTPRKHDDGPALQNTRIPQNPHIRRPDMVPSHQQHNSKTTERRLQLLS